MSTAEQIIADHQYVPDGRMLGTRCTNVTCDWFVPAATSFADMLVSYGAHVVAALTNAGKTIVELPEGIEDDDGQVWFDDLDIRVDCTGQSRPYDVWVDDERLWYVGRAKRRAAALLAAARVAEGGDQP
ncbi:hypothetical protein [Prescottella equi]|uniref:Uncharacterized protein n=1 Tax=Prescottella equi ATCC 33707 TaxID=525370 RepID=E9T095_RHOHA|nr:hypothetical protein [Prescottella equi]EGD24678.1 hypothetical protein HMPREF0724_11796 [Prescottella equi ATCC 33707]